MPKSAKSTASKRTRQRAKRERAALRMLRKSVEQQVRLAYAKVPQEAAALRQARLDIRASLVSGGMLTVEELESLTKQEAVTAALRRLTEQMNGGSPASPDVRNQSVSTSRSSVARTSSSIGRRSRGARSA